MMYTRRTVALAILFLALSAWAGVGYLMYMVSAARTGLIFAGSEAAQARARHASTSGFNELMRNTVGERETLRQFMSIDIVHFADTIDTAKKISGVPFAIVNAADISDRKEKLHKANITIQASGTFSQIVKGSRIVEALPAPALLNYLELSYNDEGRQKFWKMTARVQLVSSSNIAL